MKNSIKGGLLLAAAVTLFSCNKTKSFPVDYKYAYFPLEIGHYVIYDVDSIVFDDNTNRSDTFHYQKMHVIDSSFIDNSGREAYRLIRYHRADSSQPWFIADVWYAVRNKSSLEVVEENQRFIKLLFPPEQGQTWMGNQYLQIVEENEWLEDWEYSVTGADMPDNINELHFDSTVRVLQHDEENLIEKFYGEEKYAWNVGLVYKHLMELHKQNISAPWTEPESGFILTMSIRDYGGPK